MKWNELQSITGENPPPFTDDVLIWLGTNNEYCDSRVVMLTRIIEHCEGFDYEFIDTEGETFKDVKYWSKITPNTTNEEI